MPNSSPMSPFNDLLHLIGGLPELADQPMGRDAYTPSALRHWLAQAQDRDQPRTAEMHICILASSYSHKDALAQVTSHIEAAKAGQSPVNKYCVRSGIGLRVLELAPEMPHVINPSAPEWSEKDMMAAVAFGMEATASGGDCLGLCSHAPGSEDAAAALLVAIMGGDNKNLLKSFPKAESFYTSAVKTLGAIDGAGVLKYLQALGGREVAGLLGALIAAGSQSIPVIIEGWGALAAYGVLYALRRESTGHVRLATVGGREQQTFATSMGLEPMLNIHSFEGPGCGVATALDCLKVLSAPA